ncbi:MAG: hypothetical protein IT384_32475 [Deltaproteobacteria bacterium]|nr:hypothetical protein [Deltaproteobacteria bacterium]
MDRVTRCGSRAKGLVAIGDTALQLLARQEFTHARVLLECMIATGDAPAVMLVAYGVCLSELGESDRATKVFELVCSLDDPALTGHPLLDQAAAWLPGGSMARDTRERFQADAEKWLPRGPKSGGKTKKGNRDR